MQADLLDSDHLLIFSEGLDILAEIAVNDQPVASTDNMHRAYNFH
jgi:hypothetical protein